MPNFFISISSIFLKLSWSAVVHNMQCTMYMAINKNHATCWCPYRNHLVISIFHSALIVSGNFRHTFVRFPHNKSFFQIACQRIKSNFNYHCGDAFLPTSVTQCISSLLFKLLKFCVMKFFKSIDYAGINFSSVHFLR